VISSDGTVGDSAPMSDHILMMKVDRAITAAAAHHPGLAIRSVQATRGWGDILFVRVQARMPGARSAQEAVEHSLHASVRDALEGQRSAVSVTWSG
jgi:hypothetical protein